MAQNSFTYLLTSGVKFPCGLQLVKEGHYVLESFEGIMDSAFYSGSFGDDHQIPTGQRSQAYIKAYKDIHGGHQHQVVERMARM
jgi:hypothetical protein